MRILYEYYYFCKICKPKDLSYNKWGPINLGPYFVLYYLVPHQAIAF